MKKRDRSQETPASAYRLSDGKSKKAPNFNLSAGEGKDKVKGSTPAKKNVAKLMIHSDTETADRSKLSLPELMAARVGHSWCSLEYNDPTQVPDTVPEPSRSLIGMGYESFGFWPLINRTGDNTYPEQAQERVDIGITPGSGTSNDVAHRGFSKNPFNSWVPGRVEEPDMSHAPKASKAYDLNQEEVDKVLGYMNSKRNAQYSLYKFNCTTFAVDAVKAAGKNAPGGDNFLGVCLPNALYADLYDMQQKGDSSVTTAPLAEGEKHESDRKTAKRQKQQERAEKKAERKKRRRTGPPHRRR